MPLRAFVAVEVPPRPEVETLLAGLDDLDAHARVVASANLHLTLAFLGDLEPARVPDVSEAADAAVEGVAAFSLDLTGVGAFPPQGAPRVVWAGFADAAARARLDDLAARVRRELDHRGIGYDRKPFRAHVTLGRVKRPQGADRVRRFVNAHADWQGGPLHVEGVHVMCSTLTPGGPVYEPVHLARLEVGSC